MTPHNVFRFRSLPALCGVVFSLSTLAAPTDIHNEPLAQALSAVKPNIMFILDDSGSMDWDYLPDYVRELSSNTTIRNCRKEADSNGNLGSTLAECELGDVPYTTAAFNAQYYNPNIYYQPSPSPGGLDDASRNMNAANTSNWTHVPTNAYNLGLGYKDLTTAYPDKVWCTTDNPTTAQLSNSSICRTNSDHTYPNNDFKYDKSRNGAPYYYRIKTPQYCTNNRLTDCKDAIDTPNGYTVEALIRFCRDNSLTDCQAKWVNGSYVYPYFAGQLQPNVASARAKATITVANSGSNTSVSVSSILAGAVNLLGNTTVTASNGTNTSNERDSAATAIKNAINANTVSGVHHGYTATVNDNVVTITAPAPVGPATYVDSNGIVVQAVLAAGTQRSKTTISVTSVGNGTTSQRQLNTLKDGNSTDLIGGSIVLTAGDTTASAAAIAARINAYTNSGFWDYTATSSTNVVTIYAPLDMGAVPNGISMNTWTKGSSVSLGGGSNFSGGVGGANLPVTTTNFSGGVNPATQGWSSVIQFERKDLIETVNGVTQTFARTTGSDRPDCASTTACTFAEEMTNFANWYAYYRTRLMSAKSAAGRAFAPVTDDVRVGFITINPGLSGQGQPDVDGTRYLKINDFAFDPVGSTGHKKSWYNKLYGIGTNGGTPLREALSRVGRLYAGQFDNINDGIPAADDPIQYACQPNFAILTTDGYWNGNGGKNVIDTSIGNEDNSDSGWSLRSDGAYDGGGSSASGTLSDVAMYYYKNDLRTGMANNVLGVGKDTAKHQHMTTYTVGLGLSGVLNFDPKYQTATSGDFYNIAHGQVNTSTGNNNWPTPAANTESTLDDLWHAAVNGRGAFYSARSPKEFSDALADTLLQMKARPGAASAASVSNLNPSPGDNFVFTAQYQTYTWIGDVVARTLDSSTGLVSMASPLWSARAKLDGRNYGDRVIFTYDATDTAGNKLKHFCWPGDNGANCSDGGGLTTPEQAYFDTSQLPQYAGWNSVQKADATGATLVNFIRGDRSLETTGGSAASDLYRSRFSSLSDTVHAQPAYSRKSPFEYSDPYYKTDFQPLTANRLGTVYVAANDGMLHAYETDVNRNAYYQTAGLGTVTEADDTYTGDNAGNGEERWAYVPGILLPQLYKLASSPYVHRYLADGSPVIGDVCFDHTKAAPCTGVGKWHTILVTGLNSGGRGYYALDITDPENPKALWELSAGNTCLTDTQANSGLYSSDCHIGMSFSEALIVKRPYDGRWVVIVSSGYNNYNPGDGKGYLYVLDAATGAILQRIGTGIGDGGTPAQSYTDATPSGLGKINGWVDNPMVDNTVLAVYGGDMQGNVWRFDLDPKFNASNQITNSAYGTAFRLTTLKDGDDNPQPITVRPELAETMYGGVFYRVVMLGTGRYLGQSDLSDTSKQSIYAIRDDKSTTSVVVRTDMEERHFVTDPSDQFTRKAEGATMMDWINRKGWYIDLPDEGERVNVDPVFQAGLLTIASNVPDDDSCLGGGYAWVNYFKIDGTGISKNPGTSIIVGVTPIKLGDKWVTLTQDASGNVNTVDPGLDALPGILGKRVSWRELISE